MLLMKVSVLYIMPSDSNWVIRSMHYFSCILFQISQTLVMRVMTVHVDDDMVVDIDDDWDDGPFTVDITSKYLCTCVLYSFSLLSHVYTYHSNWSSELQALALIILVLALLLRIYWLFVVRVLHRRQILTSTA